MTSPHAIVISSAVEGPVDEAVLRRLVEQAGAMLGTVYGRNGRDHLRHRLAGYNQAARLSPWVVWVDLERDEACAPPLKARWLPNPAPSMCFRIALRAIEAWLLADREHLAHFLSVAPSRIPQNPEVLDDPKRTLAEIAGHSRRREIREDMVPRPGSGRHVGPAYTSRLMEFIETSWRPEVAATHAESLRRCSERIQELVRKELIRGNL